jgi:hypothetical protein
MGAQDKSTRRKHVPQRTCVVCHQVRSKRNLTRLVRTPDEGVLIDPTGKRAGRGAYLCDNPDCWKQAARGDVLNKALRTKLTELTRSQIAAHGEQLTPTVNTNHE